MSASKKMRELMRARIEHDKSRLMATLAESKNEMVSLVDSALAGKVNELMQQLASRDAEIARLKTILKESAEALDAAIDAAIRARGDMK